MEAKPKALVDSAGDRIVQSDWQTVLGATSARVHYQDHNCSIAKP